MTMISFKKRLLFVLSPLFLDWLYFFPNTQQALEVGVFFLTPVVRVKKNGRLVPNAKAVQTDFGNRL